MSIPTGWRHGFEDTLALTLALFFYSRPNGCKGRMMKEPAILLPVPASALGALEIKCVVSFRPHRCTLAYWFRLPAMAS